MLLGLFKTFISKDILFSIFSGKILLDTFLGASFGSISAGHPVNSYIIGGVLLKMGVSLFAVTAFLMTWVTVGLIQLPLEITVLGKRFAILRNSISFILSIPIALLTVLLLRCLR